jgi:hypothetical protein
MYSITMLIIKNSKAIYVLNDSLMFEIHDVKRSGNWWGKHPGAVRPNLPWRHHISTTSDRAEEVGYNVANHV